ncbi:MAG: Gfo/Idh/MocA family oxidoreductase [Ktedonobacteraceae bacterium]
MTKVNVGLVGLGEIAQIVHLPILQEHADQFEIAALCDLSQELLTVLGERYSVPAEHRYTDYHDIAAQGDLDALLVLNSDEYHTDTALAALQHKKHVLIEKPMCLTRQEAKSIIKARQEAGVQVMVGYMRRYAPAFVQAVEQVRALEKINYVRVRDIIGQNSQFVEQSSVVLRPNDIPQEAMRDRAERASRLVKAAIGEAAQQLSRTYRLLCGLSSHDLSAMRELLGMPKRIIAAHQAGIFLNVLFEYENFAASFETGIDHNRRFDAHIHVYGETKDIRVQYDTGYIRQLPTRLFLSETRGEAFEEREIRPTFTDPYTVELQHFYDVVTHNVQPKTSAEDFLHDLDLFEMIINALHT